MVSPRKPASTSGSKRTSRATTPEARERQMIGLAVDLVERKLREGTASSQETVHYLRLADRKHSLDVERAEAEVALLRTKIKQLENSAHAEEVAGRALRAMVSYQTGVEEVEEEDDDY